VKQEQRAYQRHHHELFQQFVAEGGDSALDQRRAIVSGDDLHPGGQALADLLQAGMHRPQRLQRVFTGAHHNNAARHFAFTVKLGNTAAHFRALS